MSDLASYEEFCRNIIIMTVKSEHPIISAFNQANPNAFEEFTFDHVQVNFRDYVHGSFRANVMHDKLKSDIKFLEGCDQGPIEKLCYELLVHCMKYTRDV